MLGGPKTSKGWLKQAWKGQNLELGCLNMFSSESNARARHHPCCQNWCYPFVLAAHFVLRDVLRCDMFLFRQLYSRIPDPTPQQPRPSARKLGKMDPGMGQPRIPVARIGAIFSCLSFRFSSCWHMLSRFCCSFFVFIYRDSIHLLFPFRFQVVDVQVRDKVNSLR